jgi:hypothetical protein
MMQARGFRTMFARSALPAYLECVAYAAEAGAARWLAGDGKAREALQTWLVYEHIQPALAHFLTGLLLPPSPRRPIAGRRPDADRRRGNGKGDVEDEAAQLFAGALAVAVSLKGEVEMESLLHQVLRAVLPLRGPLAKPLGLRLGAVAHELSQKPSLVRVATSFVQRAVQETIGVDEVLESDLSLLVALSKADLEPASVLGAGISGGDEDTGVAAALTAEYVTEYAVGAMEKLPNTVESMELVGSLLSWVAVASSDYGVTVIDAMSSSKLLPETDRLGLFASVLSAHRARGHFMKGDTLDTIVVDSVARLKGSADFPNTLVPFVQSAVSTGGGGAALKQSSLAKVASILRQCLIGYRNVDGALDICKCIFIGRSPDGGALDDLAAVVVMVLSPMESRVASAVEVVLAYCSRVSSAGACDLLRRILKLLCSSLLTRPLELGERWSRAVDAIATSAEGTRLAHIGALRVCDDLMKGGNPADAAAVNLFLTSVLVSSSPQKVLHVDAGLFDSQAFVTEYERVAMIPLDVDANSSKVIETAKRDLRSRVSSRHGSSNAEAVASAPHVAACIVDRLLRCDDRDVGQTAPLLELLETCVDSDDASNNWATAGAVAAALGKDIVPAAADIVSVCAAVLLRQGLAAFRPLLDEAVLSVRRDKGEGSACSGLAVLAAALTPLPSDLSWRPPDLEPWPPWLSECLTSALSALRRNLEASARDTSGRALLGPGSLLVARAIGGGFSLSDDDWRYWSLAALDALREAQLTDSDSLDVTLVRDICSMALLASAMVSSCGSRGDGPSMAELVTHGGWSGIKFLNAALDDGLCPVSGLVSLMSTAVDGNALIRNGHSLPMEPEEVYALVPRLGHNDADVRVAVFACVAAVACDDLPRFLDLALASGETFADEESEEAAMRDLVPCAIREALRWPKEAEDGNSSYAELGFFMSWLLFLQLVKGVDELRRVANCGAADSGGTESESGGSSAGACGGKAAAEDRSFRRVSLGFLRADSGVFAEFFTRCLGVVIDGNAAEKTAAAGASSSITEDLTHWLRHLGGNPEEYGDGLDWQVGRCAGAAFAHALQLLPALSRQHVADAVDHGVAGRVEEYVRRRVSPLLVAEEVRKVREWGDSGGEGSRAGGDGDGELSTRGSTAGREVWAAYTVSEVRLEISLRLPEAYPLAAVEIEDAAGNGERIGRGLWRRTLLQMNALLRGKDGSLAEAVALWRRSLDLRLGGLEDCPVCYSVLHLSNSTLPSGKFCVSFASSLLCRLLLTCLTYERFGCALFHPHLCFVRAPLVARSSTVRDMYIGVSWCVPVQMVYKVKHPVVPDVSEHDWVAADHWLPTGRLICRGGRKSAHQLLRALRCGTRTVY